MRPQKQLKAEERANEELRKQRQSICKNANLSVVEGEQDYKTEQFEYTVENTGCTNARRLGSAYCQPCSDEHNASRGRAANQH